MRAIDVRQDEMSLVLRMEILKGNKVDTRKRKKEKERKAEKQSRHSLFERYRLCERGERAARGERSRSHHRRERGGKLY